MSTPTALPAPLASSVPPPPGLQTTDGHPVLSFSDLSATPHGGAPIFTGLTGLIPNGCITAVLGPSGGGKSVLLRVLAGREPLLRVGGSVSMSGVPVDCTRQTNSVGYVPQEDVLIGDLTVRETLTLSARLRLGWSPEKTHSHVDAVIKQLGLGAVADNVVGTVLKRAG